MRHAVPAGDDQANGRAVLGEQRLAVHRIGEDDLVAPGLGDRERAFVGAFLAALDPAVEAR